MNVIVQSKTLVLTEALRSFAIRQAQKLFRKGRRIAQVIVFLDTVKKKKNDTHAATAKFYVDVPGKNIVVEERSTDLYLAIHEAANRTIRQLAKMKPKKMGRHKLGMTM